MIECVDIFICLECKQTNKQPLKTNVRTSDDLASSQQRIHESMFRLLWNFTIEIAKHGALALSPLGDLRA
jgi:hypothetical protein